MCDSMDLSPVSKLSSNSQDLYTAGNCDVAVRKSLFSAPAASAEPPASDAFASFSGLAELSSSTSSVPCSTFKKPLPPSTKLARAKKLHHSDKRKPGSFIARSGASTSASSLAVPTYNTSSSSSSSSSSEPFACSTSLAASCDDVAASMRRAGRAQSFCFGDRSPLSPIDLDHENRSAAMQMPSSSSSSMMVTQSSAKSLFGRGSSNRDTSPYAGGGQRSGSCPTSRRSTATSSSLSSSSTTHSALPTLRLDQLPSMDCDDADSSSSFEDCDNLEADKENMAPAGASPYRPPLFQLSPSSSPSRSGRSGAMTDRSHGRRPSASLAPCDLDSDADQFRIHRRGRGLSTSSASVGTAVGSSPFGGLSLTSSASSVATSPFGGSSVTATSPFGAADLTSSSQSVSAVAPSARRLKMRVGRSLTMSCGSLPVLHPMSSATTPGAMSLSTPDMREAHVPVLPTNPHASHSDLPCIDPNTLMRLLRGEFAGMFTRIFIIDCRFQYEYAGGHIRGALNLNTTQDVEKHFMLNPIPLKEKVCIIFHCEFSSHRGPVLCRYLRSWDRKMHEHCYPDLYYPEMYVLEGGYKKFWETADAPALCEPQAYVPMEDSKFVKEMKSGLASIRNFSTKKQGSGSFRSRSWTVDMQDEATMAALRPIRFPRLAVPSPLGSTASQDADE